MCVYDARHDAHQQHPSLTAPVVDRTGNPHSEGRVLTAAEEGAATQAGLYVCGWAKRGPSGIIGTNLTDAQETVASIAADVQAGKVPQVDAATPRLPELLNVSGVRYVTFAQWARLDQHEVQQGQQVALFGCCRV